MKLFVYGTLQRGYGNNRLLKGADFIGVGLTDKRFVLYNCGFPKAVPAEIAPQHKALFVRGEVWEINEDHLSWCDRLEGHPNWYRRELQRIYMDDKGSPECYMYIMPYDQNSNLATNKHDWYYEWSG
jgi:gamma-glutamylaminecyclotransferase